MIDVLTLQGEFRAWCFTPSHDHFFFIEYQKRIGIAISGIQYGEFYPVIDNPTILELSDSVLADFAESKSIPISRCNRMFQLVSGIQRLNFLADQIGIGEINPPYSADNLLMTKWRKFNI